MVLSAPVGMNKAVSALRLHRNMSLYSSDSRMTARERKGVCNGCTHVAIIRQRCGGSHRHDFCLLNFLVSCELVRLKGLNHVNNAGRHSDIYCALDDSYAR